MAARLAGICLAHAWRLDDEWPARLLV